jgi:hypothetical protein
MWRCGSEPDPAPGIAVGTQLMDLRGGLQYTRFLREDLAVTLSVDALSAQADLVTINGYSSSGTRMQQSRIVSVPLGLRWDPRPGDLRTKPVKFYLAAGLGPVWGAHVGGSVSESSVFAGTRVATTFGGTLGAGADVLIGRRWSLGVGAGYNWMADFPEPLGTRKNFSGFDAGVSIGWIWGRGHGQ